MFIKINDRRVNLNNIAEYKPTEKYSSDNKKYFLIRIKFANGTEEDVHFLDNEENRNEFLKLLDKNLNNNE